MIEPSSVEVHFEGQSAFWVSEPCSIEFSKAARVALQDGDVAGKTMMKLEMAPRTKYVLLR
jgi:hypothetical protein